ncbi:hypothetical protein HGRIS_002117 [Hohenbuehelia grisea]
MEMSERWIRWEERESTKLMRKELSWKTTAIQAAREEELLQKRAAIAAGDEGSTSAQAKFDGWKAEKELEWARDAALGHLEPLNLGYLHDILYGTDPDGEDYVFDDLCESNVAQDHESSPQRTLLKSDVPMAAASGSRHSIPDDLIDPVLRALSLPGSHQLPTPDPSQPLDTYTAPAPYFNPTPLPEPSVPLSGPSSPAGSNTPSRPSTPFAELQPDTRVDGDDGDALSAMSPQSRRRFKKRLYMRRKRAQASGSHVVAEAVRLKPGRKKKLKYISRPRPKTYNTKHKTRKDESDSESDVMEEEEDGAEGEQPPQIPAETSHFHRFNISGTTKQARTKAEYAGLGFDLDTLTALELDFFSLRPLARFLSASSELHSGSADTAVSAETLHLLKAIVIEFTSQLVHLSIVAQEQEQRLKSDRAAWHLRHPDSISSLNVELAAEMMGLPPLNIKASPSSHNESGTDNEQTESDTEGAAGEGSINASRDAGNDASDEDLDTEVDPDQLSPTGAWPHQGIYPAFVRLHAGLRPGSTALETSVDEHSSVLGDIDAKLLEAELDEEDALDVEDLKVSRKFENDLRRRIEREKMGWIE